jgi:hypothetical protein
LFLGRQTPGKWKLGLRFNYHKGSCVFKLGFYLHQRNILTFLFCIFFKTVFLGLLQISYRNVGMHSIFILIKIFGREWTFILVFYFICILFNKVLVNSSNLSSKFSDQIIINFATKPCKFSNQTSVNSVIKSCKWYVFVMRNCAFFRILSWYVISKEKNLIKTL